jgi:hypothetical protein
LRPRAADGFFFDTGPPVDLAAPVGYVK